MTGIKREQMVVTNLNFDVDPREPVIIMSISGGKDSLAMWIKLSKKRVPNLVPVYFIGGWEWDYALVEIKRIEKLTGDKCYILNHSGEFNRILQKRGWPGWGARWCAGYKRDKIERFRASVKRGQPGQRVLTAVGIASDEVERIKKSGLKRKELILPLVEMRIKGRQCLRICAREGCYWRGHYMRRDRLSCWCCPWQKIEDLRELYGYDKFLWKELNEMDKLAPRGRKFSWARAGIRDLAKRFDTEIKSGII